MAVSDALIEFASAVRADRAANPGIVGDGTGLELLIAPRFRELIEKILPELTASVPTVLPEYSKSGIGRPDLAFKTKGALARAFVELKSPEKPIEPGLLQGHDADQFERFTDLPVWALCNFVDVKLFRRAELVDEARILPSSALDPETASGTATKLIGEHDTDGFFRIVQALANAKPHSPSTAQEIAESLAHAARLVRSMVEEQCALGLEEVVSNVKADFNETLFARAEAGGYDLNDEDALFASAFAQTLVFGLLLAREASGSDVGPAAHELLPEETYPLLRGTLRALTLDEVRAMLGVAFDVALDAVNSVKPELLTPQSGRDPILYLYEDFLRVFDTEAVAKYGVYYTPPEIVRLIVAEVECVLNSAFGANGFLDEGVKLLDPACGTGTFLIAAAKAAATAAESKYGSGAVGAEVSEFAQRMHGFELLVGPYTVAHYRVLREVAAHGGSAGRLPIYLSDTLAPPAGAGGVEQHLAFLSAPMVAEREAADKVKSDAPILVILGNPPYKRLKAGEVERLVGPHINALWEDLKEPVRQAGHGRALNAFPDLYIAFYRWALWKLFESDGIGGRGVLGFVTNRGFLSGTGFGGLRKKLRERFDHIRIIDLRGDSQGTRPATVADDKNVFNIKVGVCILVAWSTGDDDGGEDAAVQYCDFWKQGAFSRDEKLALAESAVVDAKALEFTQIGGTGMDRLKPAGFIDTDWPSVDELFTSISNGIVTYRDPFVYATTRHKLKERIKEWFEAPLAKAVREFRESAGNKLGPARSQGFSEKHIEAVSYRPFDRRYLYNSPRFVDRPRPDLAAAWGSRNYGFIAKNDGTGAGPAVWCHGLMPDQHSFRGSYGGWIMPLWNPAEEGIGHFLHPGLIPALSTAYAREVDPQEAFDAILGLLSATSYTTRFAFDLDDDFPHVPFPAETSVFLDAARVGARLRELEGFKKDPAEDFKVARIVGKASGPELNVPGPSNAFTEGGNDGAVLLRKDGSLKIERVSSRAWGFSVSGYDVLYKWLSARNGQEIDVRLQRDMLDVIARVEETVDLCDSADKTLDEAVHAALTRAQLKLPSSNPPIAPAAGGVDGAT